MERTTFNQQMARLSIAFDRVLSAPLLSTYWDRVQNHRDDLFIETASRLIDEGEKFPPVAAIHRVYYEQRDAHRVATQGAELPRDAAMELGRRNAARLATEGLPSDVMIANGHGVKKVVGSRAHDTVLATYDRMIATLERQTDERFAQCEAHPNDYDLARRAEVLAVTLSETNERRTHFANTGETLAMREYAPDAVGVPPGTMYLCPLCHATDDAPGRYIRADVTAGSAHFGSAIPCPKCRPDAFAAYVAAKGAPPIVDREVRAHDEYSQAREMAEVQG